MMMIHGTMSPEGAINAKTVTDDFHRMMDGAIMQV
jgi:hypothetical protein